MRLIVKLAGLSTVKVAEEVQEIPMQIWPGSAPIFDSFQLKLHVAVPLRIVEQAVTMTSSQKSLFLVLFDSKIYKFTLRCLGNLSMWFSISMDFYYHHITAGYYLSSEVVCTIFKLTRIDLLYQN